MEEAAGAAALLELALDVLDAGSARVVEGVADEDHRHHDEDEHAEDEAQRALRPPETRLDAQADRIEADRQDHGPADLQRERLNDLPHDPGDQQHGAVEDGVHQPPRLGSALHGRTSRDCRESLPERSGRRSPGEVWDIIRPPPGRWRRSLQDGPNE
jgi:hypothetical protein